MDLFGEEMLAPIPRLAALRRQYAIAVKALEEAEGQEGEKDALDEFRRIENELRAEEAAEVLRLRNI